MPGVPTDSRPESIFWIWPIAPPIPDLWMVAVGRCRSRLPRLPAHRPADHFSRPRNAASQIQILGGTRAMLRFLLMTLGSLALAGGGSGCCGLGGCGPRGGAHGFGESGVPCAEGNCGPYAAGGEFAAGHHGCTDPSCGDGFTEGDFGPGDGQAEGLLGAIGRHFHGSEPPAGGPPVGTVGYPYYTVRGPRDFLRDQPATIGP
jgi:hypothetical protein